MFSNIIASIKKSGVMAIGDSLYVYESDDSGQPNGSTTTIKCPPTTCAQYTAVFSQGLLDLKLSNSSSFNPATSTTWADGINNGCFIGLAVLAQHNWITDTNRFLGFGPDLKLEGDSIAPLFIDSTSLNLNTPSNRPKFGSAKTFCGSAVKKNYRKGWAFGYGQFK
jgi:hypothetical protein